MNKFVIKDSVGKGRGLFTTSRLEKDDVLFMFKGESCNLEEALKFPKEVNERFLQAGKDLYLNLGTHFSVFTNHSCKPNCYIKVAVNNAFLLAARQIDAGEELLFDYSLTSTDTPEMWSMKCNCNPFYCRKVISGFQTIPEKQRNELKATGMVPKYVDI